MSNHFLAAYAEGPTAPSTPPPIARALASIRSRLPYATLTDPVSWTSSDGSALLASLGNQAGQLGGVSYTEFGAGGFTTFSGRPIRWSGDTAEGRSTLRPRFLREVEPDTLDGRFVVCDYDQESRRLRYWTDALGGYPLYRGRCDGWVIVGNNAEALSLAIGRRSLNPLATAAFFELGWSLSGDPLWDQVERVPPGVVASHGPEGMTTETYWHPNSVRDQFGVGLDEAAASRDLTKVIVALADWPGRPSAVPLSGGRDSRLVAAAAARSGVVERVRTFAIPGLVGFPETQDVVLSRIVAERLKLSHEVTSAAVGAGVLADPLRVARVVRALTPGTVSLADVGALSLEGTPHALELVHTGQGGELGRSFYHMTATSHSAVAAALVRYYSPSWPRPIVNNSAQALVKDAVTTWVAETLDGGFSPGQLPDLFYLTRRMGTWAGAVQVVHEFNGEATAPLWTRRMLRHEFALPDSERSKELFVLRLLEQLAPEVAYVPFEGGNPPWPGFAGSASVRRSTPLIDKVRKSARVARRELLDRRLALLRPNEVRETANRDLGTVLSMTHERAEARPSDPVFDYVDRRYALRLLHSNPAVMNNRSQQYALRLATYFLVDD